MASNVMRVHSGGVRKTTVGSVHRETLRLTLMIKVVEGGDLCCLSFAGLIKVAAAGCRLFPLVGERQRIDDGCLCRGLRDSVKGGPVRNVSGLVFAPTVVKFC